MALYKGLLTNQKTYQNSLEDLQLICDTYIENLIKTEKPKVLGEYIEQSDERNKDLEIDNLIGISVNKVFMETKSNKEQLELSNYKVVRPREFGYVSVTSRNGEHDIKCVGCVRKRCRYTSSSITARFYTLS